MSDTLYHTAVYNVNTFLHLHNTSQRVQWWVQFNREDDG